MRIVILLVAVTLCAFTTALASADAKPDAHGFVSLFNGQDLAGWEGDTRYWSVKDGAITGETTKENPSKGNTFLVYTGGDAADFELRMKCRVTGNNSGIQYRSKVSDSKTWRVVGYQADFGGGATHNAKLYDEGGKRGAIATPGEKVVVGADGKREVVGSLGDASEIKKGIKEGEWYDLAIIARGNHLVHTLNGEVMIDVVDQDPKALKNGVIALQIHGGAPMTVEFKDIRLKKNDQ